MSLPTAPPSPQSLHDRRQLPRGASVSRSPSISTVISTTSTATKSSARRPSTPLSSLFQRCRPSTRRLPPTTTTPPPPPTHDTMPDPTVASSSNALEPRGPPSLTVTPAEFQSLPPSIQKKYFSSSERLHIARQHRKSQSIYIESLPPPTNDDMLTGALSRRPSRPLAKPRQPSVPAMQPVEDNMSEEEALWFMNLPDKIRRQQFSKEELSALTARCQLVLQQSFPDSTTRAPLAHNATSSAPRPGHSKQSSRSSSHPSVDASSETSQPEHPLRSSRNRSINAVEQRTPAINFSRPPSTSTASTSDLPSTAIKPPSKPPTPLGQRPVTSHVSYYRAPVRRKSLTPIALPPPTLAPAPPVPYVRSKSASAFRQRSRTSPSPDPAAGLPPATYFRDEALKQKLRTSTTSSEAFDDAVQYGFPTTCSDCARTGQGPANRDRMDSVRATARATAARCQSPPVPRPFLLDCSDTDDESSRGPLTPKFNNENLAVSRELGKASMDSGVVMSYSSSSSPVNDTVSPFDIFKASREPTLRLTLTRSDLRDNADRPFYGNQMTRSTTDLASHTKTRPSLHVQIPPRPFDELRTQAISKADSGAASIVTSRSTKGNIIRLLKKL